MDGRKRQAEEAAGPLGKRSRSVLPLKRNFRWGCSAEHLRDLPSDALEADDDVGDAIAALLSIANKPSGPRMEPERGGEVYCHVTETDPVDLKAERWEKTAWTPSVSLPGVSVKAEPTAERLPSTSSGSDESLTTAISLPLSGGGGSSCRTSFDSTAGISGLQQHKILRQDSVQLLGKEAGMAGARQVAETVVPQLAAPLQPSVTITTKPGTCVDAAAMHASFWNASFWTPRSRLAAGPAAQPGYNVISSGVPHSPASKLPSLQASGALPDAACRSWAPQQVAQKKPAAPEQAPAPAATAAAPAASLHNGRLIIITPSASSAAAEAAWQLPSSHAVQPCQEGKREQSQWPPGHSPQAGKRAADKAAAGDSSGDEASDKVWQTNWGLDLFSALNPSVITTGVTAVKEGN